MSAAAERLCRAIRAREKILIYGDYDVDGTTSVVLLTKAIELAGGIATYHVPAPPQGRLRHAPRSGGSRRRRGRAASSSASIPASAPPRWCGVPAELGIDVIVTDHHLPEAELPAALAVLNPNRPDCPYPEKNLCGAGVAFKLAQALFLTVLGWPAAQASIASAIRF